MGGVEVRLHAFLILALHQGDWSASSSDLFNIGEGNLGAILQDCVRLTTKENYVTTVRSSWNWLTCVSDGVGLLSVAQRNEFRRCVLNTNSMSSWRWGLVAVLCGYCDGLYSLMGSSKNGVLVICCKVFGRERVGETCNTHVEKWEMHPKYGWKISRKYQDTARCRFEGHT